MIVKIVGDKSFSNLVERTNKANPKDEDMCELRKTFDEKPSLALQIGNLHKITFDAILENMCGESAFGREAANRFIKHLKTELGYYSSATTFLERVLIDEVVLRWLRLQVAERGHFNNTTGEHRMREGSYWDRRLEKAQKGYLRAVETLAKVRKMIAITQAKGARMFKDLMSNDKES